MEMKEMIYGGTPDLLYTGSHKGFDIAILNIRGTHPCAYIRLPDEYADNLSENGFFDQFDEESGMAVYDAFNADVNGGFTYGKFGRPGDYSELRDGFWLGWDYAHCDDYVAIILGDWCRTVLNPNDYGKRWSTKEILKQAISGIETLECYDHETEEDSD